MEAGTGGQVGAQPQPNKAQPLPMDLVGLKTVRSFCWQLWLLREQSQHGGPNFNEKRASMEWGDRTSQVSPREPTGGDSWFSPGLERQEQEQRERQ